MSYRAVVFFEGKKKKHCLIPSIELTLDIDTVRILFF